MQVDSSHVPMWRNDSTIVQPAAITRGYCRQNGLILQHVLHFFEVAVDLQVTRVTGTVTCMQHSAGVSQHGNVDGVINPAAGGRCKVRSRCKIRNVLLTNW